ncbi:MAG: RluA family pseudouridine synthase [Lachnospiraceae bacterium]|nr:RluA family pseudouridine synthase [Lachnospiraceae bacterium]
MNLHILFEDEHLMVCYKPAGVPTQTAKLGAADMVSLLKNYLYKKQTEKKEPYVAVIHRLDQPVEGVLVFAKTPFAARELNKGMQGVGFGKYYKAVLCGVPQAQVGVLEDYLVKDGKTNTSRICQASEKDAKKAVLSYEVVAIGEETPRCLVKIKLNTGRHHQIRVQMAHMGCPIWGDTKYGVENGVATVDKSWKQIALCAYRLEFVHPKTKKQMSFEVEPEGEGFQSFTKGEYSL